jgi:hypothetical protein
MDDAGAEKIARNNALFRDANEAIETAAVDQGFEGERPVPFLCECSDRRCATVVLMTRAEYRHVRGNPRWFFHAPGHEEAISGIVQLVERNDRYVVAEKIGHAGRVAGRLAADGETK